MRDYQYPLDLDWTTDEMVVVMKMWEVLEQAYEKGISVDDFLKAHANFKKVVPSIGEERRLGREFEKLSGYSLYRGLQAAKAQGRGRFSLADSKKMQKERKKK